MSGGRLFIWGFFPSRTPLLGTGRLIIFWICPSRTFIMYPDGYLIYENYFHNIYQKYQKRAEPTDFPQS